VNFCINSWWFNWRHFSFAGSNHQSQWDLVQEKCWLCYITSMTDTFINYWFLLYLKLIKRWIFRQNKHCFISNNLIWYNHHVSVLSPSPSLEVIYHSNWNKRRTFYIGTYLINLPRNIEVNYHQVQRNYY